jgi:hypothetical protein
MATDVIEEALKQYDWHTGPLTQIPGRWDEIMGKPTEMSPVLYKLLEKYKKGIIDTVGKKGYKELYKGIKKNIIKGKNPKQQAEWLNKMSEKYSDVLPNPDFIGGKLNIKNRNYLGDFFWMMKEKAKRGQLLSKLKIPTINFGDKSGVQFGRGVDVASTDTTNLGIDWSKQFDGTTKPVLKPKVKQPTMRDVAGPVVEQPIHKDTTQGQGQREEQIQRQQQQQQEREKYKDTATTGAKAGYTYGLQSGGRIKRKIKKVKSKYAKGGGVRTSKYKL